MGCLEKYIPNKPFIRRFVDGIKERRLYHYYSDDNMPAENNEKIVVFMADGRIRHGGLADRLCGIVSAYNYCKKRGIQFRIHYVSPYRLKDILVPNAYNWDIQENDLSYNKRDSRPICVSFLWNYADSEEYFNDKIENKEYKQLHLYTNARYFHPNEFPSLFDDLFKPSNALRTMIDENRNRIPTHYVSLTFRFQQLLGDFREDGFPILETQKERDELIAKCLLCLKKLRESTKSPVLVTSDSITFLQKANELDNVYIIPGMMRHMEYSKGERDISVDMKSYVDFFMLANADVIYLCKISPLYRSGFPETASYVFNKPYVELDENFIIV